MTDFLISHPAPGAVVIAVSGPLNVVSAQRFRETVGVAVDPDPGVRVVVDLTEVPSVDSSGLGALIGGLKAARAGGGDLRIACAGPPVVTVLELTNLNRVLSPHATVAEALGDPGTAESAVDSAAPAASGTVGR